MKLKKLLKKLNKAVKQNPHCLDLKVTVYSSYSNTEEAIRGKTMISHLTDTGEIFEKDFHSPKEIKTSVFSIGEM